MTGKMMERVIKKVAGVVIEKKIETKSYATNVFQTSGHTTVV